MADHNNSHGGNSNGRNSTDHGGIGGGIGGGGGEKVVMGDDTGNGSAADVCSGCKQRGVPLLANDDPSNAENANLPPGQKNRYDENAFRGIGVVQINPWCTVSPTNGR